MGTGQTLLTIGAVMLLGTIILTTSRSLVDNNEVLLKNNLQLEEVSLATSVIEEAQEKAFDETTILQTDSSLSQLTPPLSLGQENNDPTDTNDFDDYNGLNGMGLVQADTMNTGLIYYDSTRVCYVALGNLDGTSSTATWNKRLDVWVWSKDDPGDTVKMSTIYSYWWFR